LEICNDFCNLALFPQNFSRNDFSEEKLKDSIGFNLPEIMSWKMEEKREQKITLKPLETEDYQKSHETFLPFGDC